MCSQEIPRRWDGLHYMLEALAQCWGEGLSRTNRSSSRCCCCTPLTSDRSRYKSAARSRVHILPMTDTDSIGSIILRSVNHVWKPLESINLVKSTKHERTGRPGQNLNHHELSFLKRPWTSRHSIYDPEDVSVRLNLIECSLIFYLVSLNWK